MADRDPLRMDFDSGLRFLHVMGMRSKADILDLNTRVTALFEELLSTGVIDSRSFDVRRDRVKQRELARPDDTIVQMMPPVDKYAITEPVKLDCNALYPICKGRCCKLNFPLTKQDLDERKLEWEYARPYMIRKRADGRCVHQHETTHACTAYEHRPAICRTYDCRGDKRVWLDFEKRIPAPDLDDVSAPAPEMTKLP